MRETEKSFPKIIVSMKAFGLSDKTETMPSLISYEYLTVGRIICYAPRAVGLPQARSR